MKDTQVLKPIKVNTDIDKKYLKPDEAYYLLNQMRGKGGAGKNRPLFANEEMDRILLPAGQTYPVGTYYSKPKNQTFTWYRNSASENNHFITRTGINGVEIIYQGPMPLTMEPEHAMSQFRAYLIEHANEKGDHCIKREYLVWTTGNKFICYLDVELSIITDSFNLQLFQNCVENPLDYITLEVRQPQKCILAELEETSFEDLKTNMIVGRPWQWRFKHIYYDGRESEWSPISSLYWVDFPDFAKDGRFPRCWNLKIPAGNAFVAETVLAFRNDNSGNWFEYDRIQKYGSYNYSNDYAYGSGGSGIGGGFDQCWYTRENILPDYDPDDCTFTYKFCGDKRCDPVPSQQTNRLFNPIPFDVQCLQPIDNRLAFLNGKLGCDKLDKKELDKISFVVEKSDLDCKVEMVKVKFRVYIWNAENAEPAFIYRRNGNEPDDPDDELDTAFFGGIRGKDLFHLDLESWESQSFKGKVRNFIAYVAGSEYWTEMDQHRVTFSPGYQSSETGDPVGVVAAIGNKKIREKHMNESPLYVQEGEINVPRGTRGFIRLAGNHATGNDQESSTFLAGVRPNSTNLAALYNMDIGTINTRQKELYFDACTNDEIIDLRDDLFVVIDSATSKYAAYGYIKDEKEVPVEMATVSGVSEESIVWQSPSDHNGFYFYAGRGQRHTVWINAETSCAGFAGVFEINKNVFQKNSIRYDITIPGADYADVSFMHQMTVVVRDCIGQGIAGVKIAVSGSRTFETGADGTARMSIRNTWSQDREVKVVVMQTGSSFFKDCAGNCNPCMNSFDHVTPECYEEVTTHDFGEVVFKILNTKKIGLKKGGLYEAGIVMVGHGRRSFVQRNNWLVNIPSTQESQNYDVYQIAAIINGTINWPEWVEKVIIVRSKNLRYYDYLQWVIDKIEGLDSAGNPANRFTASSLKLTIQSLNDYNASYFFETNTKYQFTKGDRLEIITNGDGTIFSKMLNFNIKSPFLDKALLAPDETPPVDFFNQVLIDNDARLFDLEEGALIELQKYPDCEVKATFQEICSPIPVRVFTGRIPIRTFDTYLQNRVIPGRTISFSFEHHSITDIWGTKMDDGGRLCTENPYEKEQRFGRDMWPTGAWSWTGSFNGVNKFDENEVKRFLGIEMGDIIAANIRNARTMLVVCQHDNFICVVGDDIPRVQKDGTLKVNSADQFVSDPQDVPGGSFGCSYDHVGSIYFGDGYATWVAGFKENIGFVAHDYNQVVDISLNQSKRWFESMVARARYFNLTAKAEDKFRWCTGYDPITKCVCLTIRKPGSPGINNNLTGPEGDNQTITFDPIAKDHPSFASFTPECYGELNFYADNINSFITYFKGQPWLHSETNLLRNVFYGAACDRVMSFVINQNPNKEKKALALEVQATKKYFAIEVRTDKPGFVSVIPPIRVKGKLNKFNAEFLRNRNSRGGLYHGDACQGTAIAVTLVRDNSDDDKWETIDTSKQQLDDETDYVFASYVLLESSGLTSK